MQDHVNKTPIFTKKRKVSAVVCFSQYVRLLNSSKSLTGWWFSPKINMFIISLWFFKPIFDTTSQFMRRMLHLGSIYIYIHHHLYPRVIVLKNISPSILCPLLITHHMFPKIHTCSHDFFHIELDDGEKFNRKAHNI